MSEGKRSGYEKYQSQQVVQGMHNTWITKPIKDAINTRANKSSISTKTRNQRNKHTCNTKARKQHKRTLSTRSRNPVRIMHHTRTMTEERKVMQNTRNRMMRTIQKALFNRNPMVYRHYRQHPEENGDGD